MQEYNIQALGISAAADRKRIGVFYFLLSNRLDQFFVVL